MGTPFSSTQKPAALDAIADAEAEAIREELRELSPNIRILLLGGSSAEEFPSRCDAYAVSEDKWLPAGTVQRIPTKRFGSAIAVMGPKLILWGGLERNEYDVPELSTSEVYDYVRNEWAEEVSIPPMLKNRQTHGYGSDGRYLYAIAGHGGLKKHCGGSKYINDCGQQVWRGDPRQYM